MAQVAMNYRQTTSITSTRRSAFKSPQCPSHRACLLQHQARRSTIARVANVTDSTFANEVLKSDKTVLVDFWANWCGPCKLVAPLMDWAEKEYAGSLKVVKIEHDANKQLIEQFKVYGLPTLILFKDGQEVAGSKREGAVTKAMLQAYLSKHGITAAANVSS